ncbi:MAG: RNA polymerase sigma factor [Acidobacteria bacterium]|nr:RNA polymerase sigma factor [Acidobacteriota bacterium]
MTIWKGGGRDDDDVFEKIYREYYGRVWRYFRACKVSDDEAHDLAQDVFKRFYEHMPQFRGDRAAIWAFLKTTAKNILFNWIRARKTHKRNAVTVDLDDPDMPFEITAPPEPDYLEVQEQSLRRDRVRKAVLGLPSGQQQALRLWVQGMKYTEIAEALRISVDAVKSRLRDAKRLLREQLGEQP